MGGTGQTTGSFSALRNILLLFLPTAEDLEEEGGGRNIFSPVPNIPSTTDAQPGGPNPHPLKLIPGLCFVLFIKFVGRPSLCAEIPGQLIKMTRRFFFSLKKKKNDKRKKRQWILSTASSFALVVDGPGGVSPPDCQGLQAHLQGFSAASLAKDLPEGVAAWLAGTSGAPCKMPGWVQRFARPLSLPPGGH